MKYHANLEMIADPWQNKHFMRDKLNKIDINKAKNSYNEIFT